MTGVSGGKLSVRGYYTDHGKDLQMGQTFGGIFLALQDPPCQNLLFHTSPKHGTVIEVLSSVPISSRPLGAWSNDAESEG